MFPNYYLYQSRPKKVLIKQVSKDLGFFYSKKQKKYQRKFFSTMIVAIKSDNYREICTKKEHMHISDSKKPLPSES